MKKIRMIILASLLVVITGCGTENKSGGIEISNDVAFGEKDYEKIVSPANELGFKLINEVEADENNNVFISPTSLYMALSMIYNGADGVTKEEIAQVLHSEGIDIEELNKANASMTSVLNKEVENIQLSIANSIWLNDKFTFQKDFANSNKNYFNAEIAEIDIADSKSPEQINKWVKEATNDKIEKIVDSPLDADLVAVLINAIYFKGSWTHEFDKNETKSRPFHIRDGSVKIIPLMTMTEEFSYLENEDFQAISLPYGEGEMSMKVFLPKEHSNLDEFKTMLTKENWVAWQKEFEVEKGTILLPKFQLEFEASLNEALKSLGMTSAFGGNANFTNMINEDEPVSITNIKQKTFIDVNEEGTEAAAVTGIEMGITSMPINQPFHMEVNRPFFITITDDETNTILFMGSISNPVQAK
ncbi:serpin family protein [Sporosarcina sp. 6E9]|uniref:serpin family protein n=1 Tax=Sporosarcina sp. 6E9 TaxID=2819235 RepID=UPI001B301686|nr:serpin family protein [Sporosarcina sp. 6E9]